MAYDGFLSVVAVCVWQTARPTSQPPLSSRPKPVTEMMIQGDEVEDYYLSGHSASGVTNKKSPHKHFHITSYVIECLCGEIWRFKNLHRVCEGAASRRNVI